MDFIRFKPRFEKLQTECRRKRKKNKRYYTKYFTHIEVEEKCILRMDTEVAFEAAHIEFLLLLLFVVVVCVVAPPMGYTSGLSSLVRGMLSYVCSSSGVHILNAWMAADPSGLRKQTGLVRVVRRFVV